MKGKLTRIVCVGKLKHGIWREAWEHYLAQAAKWRDLEIVEIKDSPASLPTERRIEEDCARIQASLANRDAAFALAERGRMMDSISFANFLRDWDEKEQKKLTFIVGGPFGLSPSFLDNCAGLISLSTMTWPHELCRIMLVEQIFRAGCILNHFPYHH